MSPYKLYTEYCPSFLPLYRLLVAAICIFLFPFFILSTLVSGILGLIINRMVHPHTNAASSGGAAAAAATTTTATLTSATEDDDRHHNHIHHDDDDDEDDDPQDNMEYWLQRCSICFEAQLDLCLDYCRDQYCLDCFRRYVTNVVTSSWGLSVTKIRCPVCQDHIPQSEWSKFVPKSVVDQYNRFNQPYRSFSRCCPGCETEVMPCQRLQRSQPRRVHGVFKEYLLQCTEHHDHPRHRMLLRDLLPVYERQEWSSHTLLDVYKRTVHALKVLERDHASFIQPLAIAQQILCFDMKPDTWRKLQFIHIGQFPDIHCPECNMVFCLQCGNQQHPGSTCEQYMQNVVDHHAAPVEVIETFQWQLKNSRRCPSCSIMIQRDEGCNKVDCSLCGYCFCWACLSQWSDKCGFYHCSRSPTSEYANTSPEHSNAKTELGVPNVSSIQARLYPGINA
ncbi:expressed protein [Lichtheimia corymbifera JMRC:FSU:9682]|uniref:Expressed protein n=1 Tax=Lichtheimia corymbifera JMRC:FSU:9682 TaxID=1263082 RepID=A0A068RMQ2_9FUNG|nr:expressed protein [Lichtheimia corymbifera JMRC:FSU:9682]